MWSICFTNCYINQFFDWSYDGLCWECAIENLMIYIADLVCLAMVREMGALMVAIIMAGRTGASFVAELGSMKINEEIDSMKTFGISPMNFYTSSTLSLLL